MLESNVKFNDIITFPIQDIVIKFLSFFLNFYLDSLVATHKVVLVPDVSGSSGSTDSLKYIYIFKKLLI